MIVIAEVGSNFAGSLEKAKEYVRACKEAGADVVKFQCWRAEDLLSVHHPAYGAVKNEVLGLPLEWHPEVKRVADEEGIAFCTTVTQPYQIEKLEEMGVELYKVASGDLTFFALLDELNGTEKKVILSTGMANLSEIEAALERLIDCEVVLMHCVSLYPPDFSEVNLRALETLMEFFPECEVGISDHTPGFEVAVAALAMGAGWVEKHVTFSRGMGTPDAPFALEMEELKAMVDVLRRVERSLGDGVKAPSMRELPERFWARRGMYAARDMERGEVLSLSDVVFLRPCKGVPAEAFEAAIGRRLKRDVSEGEPIGFEDLE